MRLKQMLSYKNEIEFHPLTYCSMDLLNYILQLSSIFSSLKSISEIRNISQRNEKCLRKWIHQRIVKIRFLSMCFCMFISSKRLFEMISLLLVVIEWNLIQNVESFIQKEENNLPLKSQKIYLNPKMLCEM